MRRSYYAADAGTHLMMVFDSLDYRTSIFGLHAFLDPPNVSPVLRLVPLTSSSSFCSRVAFYQLCQWSMLRPHARTALRRRGLQTHATLFPISMGYL